MPPGPSGPPGPPGPSGPSGNKQRNRRSPRKPLIIAAAVVAGTATAVAFGLVATEDDDAGRNAGSGKPAPPAWTRDAGQRLTSMPGVRYDGTLTMNGEQVRLALKVTRSGLATGSLRAGTITADLVAVDGAAYVKGGRAFWRGFTEESARADSFTDRWTEVPESFPALTAVEDVLGPESIAGTLAKVAREPGEAGVGGEPAYRVKTDEADYFIAKAAPHRLLRVRTAGHGDPRLAVSPLANPRQALEEIRPRVAALGGAADPALRFRPGPPKFVNCNENPRGCTLKVRATLTVPSGKVPKGARASLLATISAGERALGSCTASAKVPSDRRPTLRCTVATRGWRTWMRAARDDPGRHPYQAHARVIGEALADSDVRGLLDLVDKERADLVPPSAPSPASSSTPTPTP